MDEEATPVPSSDGGCISDTQPKELLATEGNGRTTAVTIGNETLNEIPSTETTLDSTEENKEDEVNQNHGQLEKRYSNKYMHRPEPPNCPPPPRQEIGMLPLGPPPSYIPSVCSNEHADDGDDEDENDEDEDEKNIDDCIAPPYSKIKGGILLHKSSVRDPDRATKHVTFGKLPRRRGDDPDPCLLVIMLIVFLISTVGLLLSMLVIKGTIKVPCACRENDDTVKSSNFLECPVGWILFEDSCYGMVTMEPRNYTLARESCFQHGGYVVSLESEIENFWFVKNIVKPRKNYFGDKLHELFIGIKPGNLSAWESGEKVIYKNDAHLLDTCYTVHADKTWNATNCAFQRAFYCERAKLQISTKY